MSEGGNVVLLSDGKEIAISRSDSAVPIRFSTEETFDAGEYTSAPVNLNYDVPFKFTGRIDKVLIDYK